jgi:periplasmic protein CpxP/Spy
MNTLRKQLLITITALGLGVGAATAHARMDGPHRMGGPGYSERWQERMETRAAELQAKLKLNPAQEQAWNAYLQTMKPGERGAHPARGEMAQLSAPERLERMHAMMKEREQRMAQRVAATREFYAVLTPEQRKIFDEQFQHGRGRYAKS